MRAEQINRASGRVLIVLSLTALFAALSGYTQPPQTPKGGWNPRMTVTFQAYCFECREKVTAMTILDGKELWQALDRDADIEVMHTTEKGEHRWKLNRYEKENLRKKKAEGSI